jgi:putative PIN family toxin of toxin-antitoxin system
MTKIVIDTNIFVSAALSPVGNPAKIIAKISSSSEIQVLYSADILAEYSRVLSYKRLGIADEMRTNIITSLLAFGTLVEPAVSTIPLPDETDRIFYDAAQASGAILVTGNIKHFPKEPFIMTPADFLRRLNNKEG